MKKLTSFIVFLVFSSSVFAGKAVDQSLKADSDGRVSIEHPGGKAQIIGWDKSEVKVTGFIDDEAKKFIFERSGNRIQIKVKRDTESGYRKNKGYKKHKDDLQIYVPRGSQLSYGSPNASVEIENILNESYVDVVNGYILANNLQGTIRLETVNGEITANNLSGKGTFNTVNGNIKLSNADISDVKLKTINGDIDAEVSGKRTKVETVNGKMDVKLQTVDKFYAKSINGGLTASMSLSENADVSASSVGGALSFWFAEDVSANFDIRGLAGGRISNNLTDDKPQRAEYGPRRWLEFSTGNANANVEISTVNGRVKLNKR